MAQFATWTHKCFYMKVCLPTPRAPLAFHLVKVIRKFFIKHNKSFRWHLGDYEKHIFFHLKACERRNFDFCVFLRVGSLPVKTGLYKVN